ncbi:MAG: YdiU family protein [Pseudomonadota bacterium]
MTVNFDNSYARLPDAFHVKMPPKPVAAPSWLVWNEELAAQLGLSDWGKDDATLAFLAGNVSAEGSEPLAAAYAGQQFGNWSPQLGDGRALLLGEVLNDAGERFDIQLKGSGPTPFSRGGDGRAWLGPVLREYLVSEFMAACGVPTTRALAAVATGERVIREAVLPGAVLTRVARSHLRVGTAQYFAIRGDKDNLELLVDYAIGRLYPDLAESERPALALLQRVMEKQAALVAQWMGLGFIHGVMNTDNVALSGETIDYGPCAFMDDFQNAKVFSSIDHRGRYAYGGQPSVAHWNIVQFAQALLPLIDPDQEKAVELAQEVVNGFSTLYAVEHKRMANAKLGLRTDNEDGPQLLADMLTAMQEADSDFTNSFVALEKERFDDLPAGDWQAALRDAWDKQDGPSFGPANPMTIPRNHRIEEAIAAALEGDLKPFETLKQALATPFKVLPEHVHLMQRPTAGEVVAQTFCGT